MDEDIVLFLILGKNIFKKKVYWVLKKIARFLQACEGKNWQVQPGLSLESFFLNFEMVRMSFVSLQVQV